MTFRKTSRYQAQRAWHPRPDAAPEDQRPALPEFHGLRKFLIIGDLDSGELKLNMITLYASKRTDSYAAFFDGVRWTPRVHGRIRKTVGWSLTLDGLRRSKPRMKSARNIEP